MLLLTAACCNGKGNAHTAHRLLLASSTITLGEVDTLSRPWLIDHCSLTAICVAGLRTVAVKVNGNRSETHWWPLKCLNQRLSLKSAADCGDAAGISCCRNPVAEPPPVATAKVTLTPSPDIITSSQSTRGLIRCAAVAD